MKQANAKFKVSRYPTYFILDEKGKIVYVTNYLKKFVTTNVEGNSGYILFLKNLRVWQYKKKALALYLMVYPVFIFFLVLINRRIAKKRRGTKSIRVS
jgi:hypothetical protein